MAMEFWLRATDDAAMLEGLKYLDLIVKNDEGQDISRLGAGINTWPPGTMVEKEPDDMMADAAGNVLVFGILEADQAWRDHLQACIGEAGSDDKPSKNGHQPSTWHKWTSAQISGLAGEFFMFHSNGAGGDRPVWVRQEWSI